jgi:hypothetical protein
VTILDLIRTRTQPTVSRYAESGNMNKETEIKIGIGIKMFQHQIKQTPEDVVQMNAARLKV